MPSNETTNYKLSQWEAEDRVLRTDFNADNAKIDAALGALSREVNRKMGFPEIVWDTQSDGSDSKSYGFGLPRDFNWGEWSRVCILCQYPGHTVAESTPLQFSILFRGSGKLVTAGPLALPGYLVVLFPLRYAGRNVNGFILSDRCVPFSFDEKFQNIDTFFHELADSSQTLVRPGITVFAER